MDLCRRLSPSTLRRRFLRSVVTCDPLEAQRLAAVDQVQRVELIAVPDPADDPPVKGQSKGVARGRVQVIVDGQSKVRT